MATIEDLQNLIAIKSGLTFSPSQLNTIQNALKERMKIIKISSLETYYALLASNHIDGEKEWSQLYPLITTGESYFFRDKGHFQLLSKHVLPQIIENNKNQKKISLWSAGCSTGEEPYSLAILVREILGPNHDWKVKIIGTDINEEALQKARSGIYSEWSFRSIDEKYLKKFFKQKEQWHLDESIRDSLRFEKVNLIEDLYPNPSLGIYDIDLIVCRNVFIYFHGQAIQKVLDKFHQTLSPQGYLLTGHAEILSANTEAFQVELFPESHIWKRKNILHQGTNKKKKKKVPVTTSLLTMKEFKFQHTLNVNNKKEEKKPLATSKEREQGLLDKAREKANHKKHEEAIQYSQEHLQNNPFDASAYYLLGLIYLEQNQQSKAMEAFRKVLYLSPHYINAYIEIGYIYVEQGELRKARKTWEQAIEMLTKAPANIKYEGEASLEDLLQSLKTLLGDR
ncbi:tetratricopeptide repeat protein [Heliorestis acidaminivorans]|uniref:protein-glutamate O-methyltransferase n=1 Tax=Heliorestis acidaminivorans TaxID=553427 RepID=A0A6I0F472_9FIRM|nr:CheR family methyltransferase [Heliorestis acidaminivorans]KAB2954560.1 tetratricopeptide repeat protein [Heliorestis acidaminivorans]